MIQKQARRRKFQKVILINKESEFFLIMHFLAAKKNAKRKAAKARKAAETRVDPENEVIEDISCEFIKKLKNS